MVDKKIISREIFMFKNVLFECCNLVIVGWFVFFCKDWFFWIRVKRMKKGFYGFKFFIVFVNVNVLVLIVLWFLN